MNKKWLCVLLLQIIAFPALAGFTEVGVSGSYRRSNLDESNFTETKSITGSLSFYFAELSALEVSYTKGLTVVQTALFNQKTETEFELMGLDFILSGGGRESTFRPYIKVGAVHVNRKIVISNDLAVDTIKPKDGIAPSAGIGVKFVIQKQMSIKLGLDAWTTPLGQEPVEYDYSGRVGISWIF